MMTRSDFDSSFSPPSSSGNNFKDEPSSFGYYFVIVFSSLHNDVTYSVQRGTSLKHNFFLKNPSTNTHEPLTQLNCIVNLCTNIHHRGMEHSEKKQLFCESLHVLLFAVLVLPYSPSVHRHRRRPLSCPGQRRLCHSASTPPPYPMEAVSYHRRRRH